ncbi:hypothetical protein JMJ77_0004519 [Colletotrichum scovillei]|uniref:Uncharacterized protein n=1 Tax=Colletotrichum scovillei TaxID=1209932 RepID=A0A9P7RFD2_9PEZI|nr:hypothetical protein JMJ77_0004519 [Colletotrichum scovillei]KAG7075727.1 hypothetical protein JMJ76_0013004 [Colletotrichum scovillei]KAG7082923.1 hypothetical protein JMJ78_0008376 [Colletotrichum scovillei]
MDVSWKWRRQELSSPVFLGAAKFITESIDPSTSPTPSSMLLSLAGPIVFPITMPSTALSLSRSWLPRMRPAAQSLGGSTWQARASRSKQDLDCVLLNRSRVHDRFSVEQLEIAPTSWKAWGYPGKSPAQSRQG